VRQGTRIRVGYVSAQMRDHSVAKLFLGWMQEKDAESFEVFSYHNGSISDNVTEQVARASEHFRHLPDDADALCRAIINDKLDILVYLDVRHRRMATLGSLRLAPVQCTTWAFPITSGLSEIDFYLSSETMEPDNANEHYSECLVRLPGIGVFYHKPLVPRPLLRKGRADFGLGEGRTVFLCCQSFFKYLPQYDYILARIALESRNAQFAFIAPNEFVKRDFRKRLKLSFAKCGLNADEYCVFIPKMNRLDYLNLNILGDVFLDSLGWSGGITTLEAIACGLPIVTMPGELMRSRHSYGILTQLGVSDTIARDEDEYTSIAARLGNDHNFKNDILLRMNESQSKIFNCKNGIQGLESFYKSLIKYNNKN